MILLSLFIGIILGYFIKKYIPKLIKHFLVTSRYTYRVKFNIFMVVHKENCMVNEVISTNSIEILVKGENEEEVIDFINKMVENETRVEIESVEIV
jgi:hypothetical protein